MRYAFVSAWVLGMDNCKAHIKTIKSISYAYECTHGEQDADCEIVMVAGVGRGANVLKYML